LIKDKSWPTLCHLPKIGQQKGFEVVYDHPHEKTLAINQVGCVLKTVVVFLFLINPYKL